MHQPDETTVCKFRHLLEEHKLGEQILGVGSCPKSIPTNCLITGESYRASSTAGSDKLNHCCKKYIRSIRSTSTGGRPFPAFG
jgi:hypothetical protein